MKRDATPLAQIADWQWLCECAVRAARGKRHRTSVQRYFNTLEASTAAVRDSLLSSQLPVGSFRSFTITDPKPRIINAAPFADRVAHHAVIGKLAHRFETAQVPGSYACRTGKGAHAAILKARHIARQAPWLLKMDVHSYFAHIDHQILKGLLVRLFKDPGVLRLLRHIIDGYSTTTECGLPIGALTSQYFANHYLDGLQRYLKEQTNAIDELRYMDDVWVGCASRKSARDIASDAESWLWRERRLKLKPVLIQRSSVGLPFCGFTVSSNRLVPGKRRRRAVSAHYKRIAQAYSDGHITECECQTQISSIAALLKPGCHYVLAGKLVASSRLNQLC